MLRRNNDNGGTGEQAKAEKKKSENQEIMSNMKESLQNPYRNT